MMTSYRDETARESPYRKSASTASSMSTHRVSLKTGVFLYDF